MDSISFLPTTQHGMYETTTKCVRISKDRIIHKLCPLHNPVIPLLANLYPKL